jgi:hypothetical protein
MRIVGIDIGGAELQWLGLDGSPRGGTIFLLARNKLPMPTTHGSDFENLCELKNLVAVNLRSAHLDGVAIVRAGKDSSPLRAKCEFVVEMACHDLNVPCTLVAPQTIAAAEKRKIVLAAGMTFEAAFNAGAPINPKYLHRAACCAWTVLR